eukprot:m.189993 g.189993  ORF g.189993 m.189993 type:complete len:52 (+) comp16750_c0_seq3:27-182(+)
MGETLYNGAKQRVDCAYLVALLFFAIPFQHRFDCRHPTTQLSHDDSNTRLP